MAAKKGECSASGGGNLNDLPEPDYDHLSLAYLDNNHEQDFNCPQKPGKSEQKEKSPLEDPPYILGTLVVRVVAGRDLQPARNAHGGLGDFLFGGKGGGGGSANPYASVKFGTSTQRTSDLYDTLDPVWPRGETMFMDVSLNLEKTTHPDPTGSGQPGQSDNGENTTYLLENDNAATPPMDSILFSSRSLGHSNPKNQVDDVDSLDTPTPILTLAVFSASKSGKTHKTVNGSNGKYPSKKGLSGDSDDEFLGMASVDLTSLLTGKRDIVDTWLPLAGGSGGSVRIACEYETTDCAPNKGDLVRFTRFCHPADLFPLAPGSIYPVEEVLDNDYVLLSYKSPEGWICSFMVHRFMVLCVDRHHGAVEACRDAAVTITDRLSHSPLVGTVTQTVERLPEEGLLSVGANVIRGGFGLLGRWLDGGIDTAIKDVAFATNWDGRFNPGLEGPASQEGAADENIADNNIQSEDADRSRETEEPPITLPETSLEPSSEETPLPNMPSCPITSEPMLDPVVAADGHTYERAAIARWLQTSDKSPLTGSILPHKELVPNYGLLSSLQEQADAYKEKAPPTVAPKQPPKVPESKVLAPVTGPGVTMATIIAEEPEAKPRSDAMETTVGIDRDEEAVALTNDGGDDEALVASNLHADADNSGES